MAVETAKDKIRFHQIIGQKQENLTIDGDVIVNDVKPDVLKIISTSGTICVYKKELLEGKLKLEGCINTYIIYLADDEDGSVRTINTSLDFAEIIDMENCKPDMTLDDNLSIKGFETRILNGRKLHVKAFLDANIKVYSNSDVEAITEVKDDSGNMQMLNCTKNVMSLVGENTGKTTMKETIDISSEDEIAEIMKVNLSISDIETKTSYNKVLVKAKANVDIMYLTEDNRISTAKAQIPLMGFIDLPDVTDSSECMAKVKLKNMILKANSLEEHSIYLEADIELSCMAYETKEINIIEDVYSVVNDVDLKTMAVRTSTDQFSLRENYQIEEKLSNPELLYGRILGANIVPVIDSVDIKNNRISYQGKLNTEIMVSGENTVNVTNLDIPFELELSSDRIKANSMVESDANIVSQEITTSEDGIMLKVELEINAIVQNDEELKLAQDIILTEPKDQEIYSMVIYFVKPGDSLWKIAKKFKSRVEDIARINGIEDTSKIYPGDQLYIPKFIKSRAMA